MKKAIFTAILLACITQTMLLAQQVTDVKLETLLGEWDSNKIRVKQNYGSKTIRTTGKVTTIYTDNSILLSIYSEVDIVATLMFGMGWALPKTNSIRVNLTHRNDQNWQT